jgi:hypothetical protein
MNELDFIEIKGNERVINSPITPITYYNKEKYEIENNQNKYQQLN